MNIRGIGIAWLAACSADVGELERPVVGGQPETGYPAVGYMMIGATAANLAGPYCGATLVAPRVAVTAAHCLVGSLDKQFGLGLGGEVYPAERVLLHGSYDRHGAVRYRHDLAALLLVDGPPVEPAGIADAAVDQVARYIGYGRVTPGDYDRADGYTGERKSAAQRITTRGELNLWTRGVDGGLCWGDSGGPLMAEGTNDVLGVLADFDGTFDCHVGNAMIFASLWGERDWIAGATECSETAGPCTPCQFRCETYGYAADECRAGWFCDGRCITHTGCNAQEVCQYTCADYGYTTSECHEGWRCDGRCLDHVGSCGA